MRVRAPGAEAARCARSSWNIRAVTDGSRSSGSIAIAAATTPSYGASAGSSRDGRGRGAR